MSIKILCTGDMQLDKSFGTLGKSATSFRNQLFETWERIMKDAKKYDLVLVAGDLFDREGTPLEVIEKAANVLTACPTKIVVLAGNHDSLKSGIPSVLRAALEKRGADHVIVPLERKPLSFPEMGITVYPVPLTSKGDISNLHDWIPPRNGDEGIRLALLHGAIEKLPKGKIPSNLAQVKDLDLVVCGDQHGPKGDENDSDLFSIEESKHRRLVYAMAPEALDINQGFVGSYTRVVMDASGIVEEMKRIQVGELRFLNTNVTVEPDADPKAAIEEAMSSVLGRPTDKTCIRLSLEGELSRDARIALDQEIARLKAIWPLLEVLNTVSIVLDDEQTVPGGDDPLLSALRVKAEEQRLDSEVLSRAITIYELYKGRWI
jgi:predicted phosphodiesterase